MAKGKLVVNLERDWFAPDGSLYEVRHNPHEFPADWEDQIPRIKKVKLAKGAEPAEVEYEVDKEARKRIIVENPQVVETQRLSADGTPILVAEAVPGDVKSVGNTVDETTKGPADHNKTHQSTPLSKAVAAAKESGAEVGGKPRESNPPGGMPGGKR